MLEAVRRIHESVTALQSGGRAVAQAVAGADGGARGRIDARQRVDDYAARQAQLLGRITTALTEIERAIDESNR